MSDILIQRQGKLGRITMNRPKALNALTFEMTLEMHAALREFANDTSVASVLVDGAGERGLCAGGDIRSIYEANRIGDDLAARFWREEYIMNAFIARYPKPYIAIMDGIVMGGGIGISAHGSHRIVTERTKAAMPEVAIGFSPDVGGTWLLSRAPGEFGTFAALTANVLNAGDAIHAGLADWHVPSSSLPALVAELSNCVSRVQVDVVIARLASEPAAGLHASEGSWIDSCFAHDDVEAIVDALAANAAEGARKAHATMSRHCPKSLKVALKALREARGLATLEQCLQMEYRVALACIAEHDMSEGIRAVVIDKDQKPRWSPATLGDVTQQHVDAHFAELPIWSRPATG